ARKASHSTSIQLMVDRFASVFAPFIAFARKSCAGRSPAPGVSSIGCPVRRRISCEPYHSASQPVSVSGSFSAAPISAVAQASVATGAPPEVAKPAAVAATGGTFRPVVVPAARYAAVLVAQAAPADAS